MAGRKTKTEEFTEALGEEVDSAFKRLVFLILKEGALSVKDKALITLACSVAVRCERCIERHKETARKAGASQEEMLEAAAIAGLVRMGSGFNAAATLLDDD
ncbi:MAG: carboxymuconolactone decarboxylase family protein [Methanotrichaceae archaeon]|nr:carboxymuconolactone decarboxylase family protein [Methanotrichaceae archaeon]